MKARMFLRRWTAHGVTHAVFRASGSAPYRTLCELWLKLEQHRSVKDVGVLTCVPCAHRDTFGARP